MLDQVFDKLAYIVVGAATSWFFQQYRVSRSEDGALITEHIKDIEKFRDLAQEYWLTTRDPKLAGDPLALREKDLALAAKVRAAHAATTIAYSDVLDLCQGKGGVYQALSLQLHQVATGGEFESKREGIDANRAMEIFDTAAQLIHHLRAVRREVLSLGRFFAVMFGVTYRTSKKK